MDIKILKGEELLYMQGHSNKWADVLREGRIIINFNNRWEYKSFSQYNNTLTFETKSGHVTLEFPMRLEFKEEQYEKDQLILSLKYNRNV